MEEQQDRMKALVECLEDIRLHFQWLSKLPVENATEQQWLLSTSATNLWAITDLAIQYYKHQGTVNAEPWEFELLQNVGPARVTVAKIVDDFKRSSSIDVTRAKSYKELESILETWLQESTASRRFVEWLKHRKRNSRQALDS